MISGNTVYYCVQFVRTFTIGYKQYNTVTCFCDDVVDVKFPVKHLDHISTGFFGDFRRRAKYSMSIPRWLKITKSVSFVGQSLQKYKSAPPALRITKDPSACRRFIEISIQHAY